MEGLGGGNFCPLALWIADTTIVCYYKTNIINQGRQTNIKIKNMKKVIGSLVIVLGFLVFSVASAQSVNPTISNISPSQGTANTSVTIYGANLSGASSVEFYNSSGQISGSLVPSSVSATNVVFTISGVFAANMSPGTYQVGVVTNACAGGCNSNRVSFTLTAPVSNSPTISNISPSQGTANTSVTIYGANLSGASSVEFYNSSGQISGSLVPSSVSATNVVFTISGVFAANMSPGTYQVGVVTNACAGGCNSNRVSFTLTAPVSNIQPTPQPTPQPAPSSSENSTAIQLLLQRIQALQNQINSLKSQVGNTPPPSTSGNQPTNGNEGVPVSSCLDISNNLTYRSRDVSTGGDVSALQDFLQAKGYLNSEPTGFFGVLTLQAVKSFQQANGISPTGFVGPITRAKIKSLTCGQ